MATSQFYKISQIILKDNKITRTNYKATTNIAYQIASCSKFITSLVVAKLYEADVLDYDENINKYLKKWKCPVVITLKNLLTHTSGATDHNGYMGFEPQTPLRQTLNLNMEILDGKTFSKPVQFTEKPNKQFIYSGAGYQVIQQVLEEITGRRLHQLMQKYIFTPLGMKNSTGKLLYTGKHNYKIADMKEQYRMYPETAAAGVWMSPNDLMILLIDLMNGINNDKSKILSRDTIKKITTGQICKLKEQWGLGMHAQPGMFSHGGMNYSYLMNFYCDYKKRKIEVIMVNYVSNKYTKGIMSNAKRLLNK
jgi:CubicO group peptidase (beta-lactamase class C family)